MFEVVDVPIGDGWVMVVDLVNSEPPAALFAPEWSEVAQEMADRLNVRELAHGSLAPEAPPIDTPQNGG